MPTFAARLCLFAILCSFAACQKITADRFGRTSEPDAKPDAMTLQEVSFMVRMGEPDAEVLGRIAHRGLAHPIDDKAAANLTAQGAPLRLLDQLRKTPYLLTPAERTLYVSRQEKRKAATDTASRSQDELIQASRVELNDRIRSVELGRIEARLKQEKAQVRELEKKLKQERYSASNNSPYQSVARELEDARTRSTQTSEEVTKLKAPKMVGR